MTKIEPGMVVVVDDKKYIVDDACCIMTQAGCLPSGSIHALIDKGKAKIVS